MHVKDNWAADAADGQWPGQLIVAGAHAFRLCALEGDGGVLGGIEEITAA
jgi:hypothetical protein